MPAAPRSVASVSMLNCGWRCDRGSLRTSAMCATPCARTSATNASSACVEWPTVHTPPAYPSTLDRARGHPLHEPLRQEQVEHEHRQRGDHEARGQHADVLVLVGHQKLDG